MSASSDPVVCFGEQGPVIRGREALAREGSRRGRLLIAIATVAAAGVLAPGSTAPTQAAGCPSVPLIDSKDNVWTVDGATGALHATQYDAAEGWGTLTVAGSVLAEDPAHCGHRVAPGDVRFGELPIGALMVSRRVYVPPTGRPFVRFADVVRNPTANQVHAQIVYSGKLSYGAQTLVVATPNGNTTADPGEPWTVTDFDQAMNGPTGFSTLHVWDGENLPKTDANDGIFSNDSLTTNWTDGVATARVKYQQPDVAIAPHSTAIYLHLEAAEGTNQTTPTAFAQSFAAGPAHIFEGMSSADLGAVRNWNTTDVDGDGQPSSMDNCPTTANPQQVDTDHDGIGNACDNDIDGDGLSNAEESARKTNPLKADTDGDGKRDDVDVCPRTAGKAPNGCPDTKAPPLKLGKKPKTNVAADRFRRGLKAIAIVGEVAKVDFELRAKAKGASLSGAAYNLTIAHRSIGFGKGKRSVVLKPSKSLVGSARNFTVQLRVVATDHSGNRATRTRVIHVH